MAIPTVEEASNRALFHLAGTADDSAKRRFPEMDLQIAIGSAWEEMIAYMSNAGVSAVELTAEFQLPPNTDTLLPSTAGISNFGTPIRLWERPGGTNQDYALMDYAEILPQQQGGSQLHCYKWANSTFEFVAVPGPVDLRIEYRGSGKAPDSGTLGIDGCLNVVAKLAAAIVGRPKGLSALADTLRNEVYGFTSPSPRHMHVLIQPMLRFQQRRAHQLPAYGGGSPRRMNRFGKWPFTMAQ